SLYSLVKIPEKLVAANTWFAMDIIAVGPRIRILVDGKPTVDYTDPKAQWLEGAIALQQNPANGITSDVRFRKLEIRELRPGDVAEK
ncbi:MAG TPA: DUF1080 domain-containing protein, partial [Pirellulales bacterium]|nr:DUF1080 domain-containing protein [Pirellulales bacterium]